MKRLALVFAFVASCGTPPEEDACSSIVEVTAPAMSDGAGAWVVGGFASDRVHFTPLTTFALPHGLGRAPTSVECWLSFTPDGPQAKQIGSTCLWLTRCNQRDGRTDREVLIRNSGSQDFWARFVIR